MKVFLSWSGEQSGHIARALRTWLHEVIQAVYPWMSEEDIGAGARWNPEFSKALEESEFGILVVTPDNVEKPWLNFEAGALANSMSEGRVCPYVHGMELTDIPPGPLTQFQAKRANRADTHKLVLDLNDALPERSLAKDLLTKTFDRSWGELEGQIAAAPEAKAIPARRTSEQMLEEILTIARRIDSSSVEPQDLANFFRNSLPTTKFSTELSKSKTILDLQAQIDAVKESVGLKPQSFEQAVESFAAATTSTSKTPMRTETVNNP